MTMNKQTFDFFRKTKITEMNECPKISFNNSLIINGSDSKGANDIVISGISGKISKISLNIIRQKWIFLLTKCLLQIRKNFLEIKVFFL